MARETDMTGREPVPGKLTLAREDLTAGLDAYRRLGIELQARRTCCQTCPRAYGFLQRARGYGYSLVKGRS